MSKTPEDMQILSIIVNIVLNLESGVSETLFDLDFMSQFHDASFLPEKADGYEFLKWIPINSSTDICAYICAAKAISNEWDTNVLAPYYYESDSDVADAYSIIPQLFLFCQEKLAFPELLDNIRTIQRKSNRDRGIVFEWLSDLEEISPEDYDSEKLISTVMNVINEIIDDELFKKKALEEISMPWPPIQVSEIKSIDITNYKWNHRDYIDWYEYPDDVEEFKRDSEIPGDSAHFKYLKTKWSVFQYEHIPFEYEEILDGSYDDKKTSGCEILLSVEEALKSGDINNLLPEWWYDKFELHLYKNYNNSGFMEIDDSYTINNSGVQNVFDEFKCNPSFENLKTVFAESPCERRDALRYAVDNKIKIAPSRKPLEFAREMLYFDCYDAYMLLKDCIEETDPETVGLLMSVLELPDEFMEFWHVGIMHDAISSDSAGITANLLNSGKLRFTDEELAYLIDYASESGKTEHTACLLNYKNDNTL